MGDVDLGEVVLGAAGLGNVTLDCSLGILPRGSVEVEAWRVGGLGKAAIASSLDSLGGREGMLQSDIEVEEKVEKLRRGKWDGEHWR